MPIRVLYSPDEELKKKKKGFWPTTGGYVLSGLEMLERPSQALKVGIKETLDEDPEGFLEGARRGWMGEDAVRMQDFMDPEFVKQHPFWAGVGGFIGDVATDPLTYLGPGLVRGTAKGISTGAKKSTSKCVSPQSRPIQPMNSMASYQGSFDIRMTYVKSSHAWSMHLTSRNLKRFTGRRWCAALHICTAIPWASWLTTASCFLSRRKRVRISFNCAIAAAFLSCSCKILRASWLARNMNMAVLRKTARKW